MSTNISEGRILWKGVEITDGFEIGIGNQEWETAFQDEVKVEIMKVLSNGPGLEFLSVSNRPLSRSIS